jgi:predicted 3-demethylubiquinone-9 3-methyltransferase (glyoxalase superfamily)
MVAEARHSPCCAERDAFVEKRDEMKGITPNLWFDDQAEEAARYYVSVFPNSKLGDITHYDEASSRVAKRPVGSVLTVAFELDGQPFVALNGGPVFKFSEAVSFAVNCESQDEIDFYWDKLIGDGGQPSECGWLKDQFGLSWQISPVMLEKLLTNGDPVGVERMMAAMLKMKKLDIADLQRAYDGE